MPSEMLGRPSSGGGSIGGTKDEIRTFEALLKYASTQHPKSIEHPDFIFCSLFQNPRLVSMNLSNASLSYHACVL
jgi:hypothetical protein